MTDWIANSESGSSVRSKLNSLRLRQTIANSPTYIGPELVSNTDFASNSDGWTLGADSIWGAGQIVTTNAGDAAISIPIVGLVAGSTYLLSIDCVMSGDLNYVYFDNLQNLLISSGAHQGLIFESGYTGDDNLYLDFYAHNSGAVRTVTSVSMREISAPVAALSVSDQTGVTVLSIGDGEEDNNIFLGQGALQNNGDGEYNVAVGYGALQSNSDGEYNIAIGRSSIQSNADGLGNIGVGMFALVRSLTGNYNIAIGSSSSTSLKTGSSNVAIGHGSLASNVSGSNNVGVGESANVSGGALSNAIAIGSGSVALASNTAQIGNANVRSLNIGVADTVSTLPSASTVGAGARSFVTDADTTLILGIGTVVVGDGSNKVPVYSDGADWLIG